MLLLTIFPVATKSSLESHIAALYIAYPVLHLAAQHFPIPCHERACFCFESVRRCETGTLREAL